MESKVTYNEAVAYIEAIPQYADKTGVERSIILLDEMNHPEQNLKIIHIAGTNGKGSTCAYINQILISGGYSVGLFTSPHLVTIRERIQVNGKMIDEDMFMEGFEKVYSAQQKIVQKGYPSLAYFDFVFGMAMYIFNRLSLEYVVMETGLGGRLDSTNAVTNQIIAVIASISLEHTQVLGDTVEKIAAEKAGIIKEHEPVVYLDNIDSVGAVIRQKSEDKKSKNIAVNDNQWEIIKNDGKHIDFLVHNSYYKSSLFSINTGAPYQVANCMLAITAVNVLQAQGYVAVSEQNILTALMNTTWIGRMEEVAEDVYIDGAHNPDGIRAFIEAAKAVSGTRKCTLLFSAVRDKNYENMIRSICNSGIFDKFIITGLNGSRRLETETIQNIFSKYTDKPVELFEDSQSAYEYGVASKGNGLLMCAGSLYLAGEIKSFICGH